MNIETDISIKKEKTKFVAIMSIDEFKTGQWLDNVPNGKNVEIKYTARSGVLIILNTPLLQIRNREGI